MLFRQNFWLLILPLLFIPNNFLSIENNFGSVQLADIILLLTSPFWISKFIIRKKNTELNKINNSFFIFIFICYSSLFVIQLQFDYEDNFYFIYSLIKVFKFSIYVLFGLFVMDRFRNKDLALYNRNKHIIIILISLVILINFFLGNIGLTNIDFKTDITKFDGYTTTNVISVALAILSASIIPYLLNNVSIFKLIYLGFISISLILTGGRGGVIAFLAVLTYYLFKYLTFSKKVKSFFLGFLVIAIFYNFFPEVKFQIDRTIFPDQDYLRYNNMGVAGIDDGKRISGFLKSFPDWYNKPLLGYGFFHRGGLSDLKSWGSHNFYLQILLELGLIGFISLLNIFRTIRKKLSGLKFVKINSSISLGLLASFIAGLSGEYFYGSESLLAFMILIIPLGMLSNKKN